LESTPSPPKKAATIPILKKAATVSTPKKAATAIISAPNKAVTMATPKKAVVDESTSESYTPTPRKSVVISTPKKSPLASIQLKSPVVSTPNKFAAPPVPPAPKTATKSIPNPPDLNKVIYLFPNANLYLFIFRPSTPTMMMHLSGTIDWDDRMIRKNMEMECVKHRF
jgi:hypothetical protein